MVKINFYFSWKLFSFNFYLSGAYIPLFKKSGAMFCLKKNPGALYSVKKRKVVGPIFCK